MKTGIKIIIIIILAFANLDAHTKTNITYQKPKYKRVAQAYGYIIGNEKFLQVVEKNYPEYALKILRVRLAFESSFGRSKIGIKNYLIDYMGHSEFIQYDKNVNEVLGELYADLELTEEFILYGLNLIENNANGIDFESPILETLLSFQYAENPHDEFFGGFTYSFSTKGHPKSKNSDIKFKIPKSWKAQEAERPNIIQKFTNDYGQGIQSIMIMVVDLGYKLEPYEIKKFFSKTEIMEMIPTSGKFISHTDMTFDGFLGCLLVFEQTQKRLDLEINTKSAQFMFIYGDKAVYLTCSVNIVDRSKKNIDGMEKYLPLFKAVANSIVVMDRY
ncbi:MAG: hypothetical protein LAT68_14125 [Cyclobacteriaceae bacterium]|nr:hypothetical protein [Cyclobacteriaceae bacterium]MCH8517458.1 hypothetical protein [Cyclobacteriaceae bacterium]